MMHASTDFFKGSFYPSGKLVLSVGEVATITFRVTPIEHASNLKIKIILPLPLVELVAGNLEWTGNVEKDQTVELHLSIKMTQDMAGYIRASVEADVYGQRVERSYYLSICTT